ncbi:MAG: hypothetical protein E6H08_15975 [Bacteroidetes bacterium]|nr:MAG: hypothetical protein E6H08_15975 [Bacteroidota bacterium]
MEATRKRNIKPGYEYDKLFPGSEGDTKTIRKNANVTHTVEFIPKVVNETLNQTKKVAHLLKGKTIYETCKNIWHFVYQHINYKKDQEGFEQIRSPARAWHDRRYGVDPYKPGHCAYLKNNQVSPGLFSAYLPHCAK